MRYRDFEVSIRAVPGGAYEVEARSPEGGATEQVAGASGALAPAETAAPDGREAGAAEPASRDAVLRRIATGTEEKGRALFARFFTGRVRAKFDEARSALAAGEGLRIAIRAGTKEIEAAPWEALAGDQPIASDLRTPVVRRPILEDVRLEAGRAARRPRLRVLVVLASPKGLPALDLAAERARVTEALSWSRILLATSTHFLEDPSLEELRVALGEQWDVLHFAGHGGHDAEGAFLALRGETEYEELYASKLALLLSGQEHMLLAFLNCCHGADLGPSPAPTMARELLEARLLAVVGMQSSISDEAATLFAKAVYGALGRGGTLEEGVTAARQALILKAQEGGRREDWIPALFLREGVELRRPWLPVAVGSGLAAAAIAVGVWAAVPPRFTVTVVDRDDRPLAGAKVTIEGAEAVATETDERGAALFRTRARRAKVVVGHQEYSEFDGELPTGGKVKMCWRTAPEKGFSSPPCYLAPGAPVGVRVGQVEEGLVWSLTVDPQTKEEWKLAGEQVILDGVARTFEPVFGGASKGRRWVMQATRSDGVESLSLSFSVEQQGPSGTTRCARKAMLRQIVPIEIRSTAECESACQGVACNRRP